VVELLGAGPPFVLLPLLFPLLLGGAGLPPLEQDDSAITATATSPVASTRRHCPSCATTPPDISKRLSTVG
jgi:hypothetical protein